MTEAEYLTDVNCVRSFWVRAISGMIAKCDTWTTGQPNWNTKITMAK